MVIEFHEIPREKSVIELHSTALNIKPIRCGREQPGEGQCTNPAQWQVVFKVRPYGAHRSEYTKLLINLHLCNKCKKKTIPEDFMHDPQTRNNIAAQLTQMGHPLVNMKALELEFIPVKDKTHAMTLREFMETS